MKPGTVVNWIGKIQCWDNTPKILGPTLKAEYPDVKEMARCVQGWRVTTVGDRKFSSEYLIVDPAFLDIFSFPFKQGKRQNCPDEYLFDCDHRKNGEEDVWPGRPDEQTNQN